MEQGRKNEVKKKKKIEKSFIIKLFVFYNFFLEKNNKIRRVRGEKQKLK